MRHYVVPRRYQRYECYASYSCYTDMLRADTLLLPLIAFDAATPRHKYRIVNTTAHGPLPYYTSLLREMPRYAR